MRGSETEPYGARKTQDRWLSIELQTGIAGTQLAGHVESHTLDHCKDDVLKATARLDQHAVAEFVEG